MYRWHVADPIHFAQKLRVDIQALGWRSRMAATCRCSDDIASTALFYLDRPTARRPRTPSADDLEIHLGTAPVPDLGSSPPRPPA